MLAFEKKTMCTGCTACASICPKKCLIMVTDEHGFFYPELKSEKLCVDCKLCEKVCPLIQKKQLSEEKTEAYAVYSKNEKLRLESSSGGIFSEIAKVVIEEQGVVYGAAYSNDFTVEHKGITEEQELYKLRGAKYSQSDLKEVYVEIQENLEQGKKVLFSGTPCSVAGLKTFLRKDYENLLCIDFICHGVPSPRAWKEYTKYRALKDYHEELPLRINLRSKTTGWSHYHYSIQYEYSDGTIYSVRNGQDLFMKLFVEDYINRSSCSNCMFKGDQREGDLTIADFWGIWDVLPEMDDDKGTSAVLIHSKKGKAVFKRIEEHLQVREVSTDQIAKQNSSLRISSQPNEKREEVLNMICAGGIEEIYDILPKEEAESMMKNIVRKVFRLLQIR